jgi:assimilatory nitrate reductase catalytic subunit
MTRTGKSPRLASHVQEPFIDLHPQDALLHGVRAGELARVSSQWGQMVARVQHGGGMARGAVFIPIHWSGQTASDARVGALVSPAVDPVSGEPEFKHTPVRIEPFGVRWHGFILSRRPLALDGVASWTKIRGTQFYRYELAGRNVIDDATAWSRAQLGVTDPDADWLDYADKGSRTYRAALLVDGVIDACIFIAPTADLPARAWLASLFEEGVLSTAQRMGLLAGRSPVPVIDAGPTVCSCFGVGRNTICAAVRQHGLTDVAGVTACVKAGGNCGSCVPEIRQLLVQMAVPAQ